MTFCLSIFMKQIFHQYYVHISCTYSPKSENIPKTYGQKSSYAPKQGIEFTVSVEVRLLCIIFSF